MTLRRIICIYNFLIYSSTYREYYFLYRAWNCDYDLGFFQGGIYGNFSMNLIDEQINNFVLIFSILY